MLIFLSKRALISPSILDDDLDIEVHRFRVTQRLTSIRDGDIKLIALISSPGGTPEDVIEELHSTLGPMYSKLLALCCCDPTGERFYVIEPVKWMGIDGSVTGDPYIDLERQKFGQADLHGDLWSLDSAIFPGGGMIQWTMSALKDFRAYMVGDGEEEVAWNVGIPYIPVRQWLKPLG